MQATAPVEVELEVPTADVGHWNNQTIDSPVAENTYTSLEDKDHFIQRNGVEFAGTHLLLDLYDATQLDNIQMIVDKIINKSNRVIVGHIIINHSREQC